MYLLKKRGIKVTSQSLILQFQIRTSMIIALLIFSRTNIHIWNSTWNSQLLIEQSPSYIEKTALDLIMQQA